MTDKNGTLDTNQGVWVLRHDAPVYPTFDASHSSSTQAFGEYLLPVKVVKHPSSGVQRVQVRKMGTDTPLGWMEGYDLLCRIKPLQSKKGLDRKVFVKTPSSHMPVYPAYKGPCNGNCEQLTRFELYFIFAEDRLYQRYLILKAHSLKDKPFSSLASKPMGWVKYDHTIPWNTTLGLRPIDTLDKLLAYKKPEDINNPSVEIAGGNIWYTYPIHIPILDIKPNYYHVAAQGDVFYIPIDASKVQEEVWMTATQLADWLALLKGFEKALPVQKQRTAFVYRLRKQIQDLIGRYPPSHLVLREWLAKQRKQVLPIRQDSPLLQYSLDEIRRKIEDCEVSLLVNWVTEIRKVLQKVSNDSTQKVAFRPKYPTSISCPLSDKGKKVPESLEFEPSAPLGSDDNYRYDHSLYGKTVYWLPVEFLP
ncbi:hypothetical protein THIOM_001807 [Candidatus Thiomargarita nelsonii]|uniref:Uncharacterized protein n=1 Tax=Candidatus Thiomargarita nelsonii TaxID=1003181 RepID=A0A0A6NZJ2_9GAMM|nr:hypothetical protein THIOM_001807 [Candidatus Thiomargarita nelsonii]